MPLEDLEASRREKLEALKARGIDPFGGRYEVTAHARELHERFSALEGRQVRVAGRLMALRSHGKVAFADLQDVTGRIQLYLREGEARGFDLLPLLDLGDLMGAAGTLMKTRRGEISVQVEELAFLTKALRPLPEKWHGLKDVDQRYRERELDLIANPEVREAFIARARIISVMRSVLDERGFIEVETPVLTPIPGGARARPFVTHHNALDLDLYLRIATELPLKRLIVGGLERVYEIGRVFRNEGISTRHNPEFTMLECYQAYADYEDMMKLTEEMVAEIAEKVLGSTKIIRQGVELDFTPPWRRVTMAQALEEAGVPVGRGNEEELFEEVKKRGGELPPYARAGHAWEFLFEELVQPYLIQPTFVLDFPIDISPLARERKDAPHLVHRFEAIVQGMELANAFSELNDPDEQRRRFQRQVEERLLGNEEAPPLDETYVRSLEYGLPPTGGLGIGIDRLVMLLLDQPSIRDVILFPLMRPKG
ncbi:MAG: lysine--tRNA ligase [Bacillota bacterium]|nr:lysine--tRNA ligase [Bacillota bacterium]